MQVDYQEITAVEAKEIAGGSLLGELVDAAIAAAAEALHRLAGPNV
ncbi:hypothetical protein [Spirosoma rhododendri]|uniref:Uncharacterized protein n=1 Tax=Spirosoma rhododendri TaxID=2728024 RepID=A0A7L5DWN1_9BACT|nr:hypothetical protein [Spirosoma rhododendri]QJD81048.1 hypothetical protein HH216_23445 [Spirosoma rhododendri]